MPAFLCNLITASRLASGLDAGGMVVAPGFIDHQHAQNPTGYRLEALGGTANVDRWYAERSDTSLSNYGASIGHDEARKQVMHNAGKGAVVAGTFARLLGCFVRDGLVNGAIVVQ